MGVGEGVVCMGHGAWGWIYMVINCVCMGIKLHGKRKQIENKLAINDTVHFFPQLVQL